MSRVWSRRGSGDDGGIVQPTYEEDGVPFYGPDPYADPYGMDDSWDSADSGEDAGNEDIAALAREARSMAQMMGEPLDPAFDSALRHIEQGADPDDVFGEMDAGEPEQKPSPVDEP